MEAEPAAGARGSSSTDNIVKAPPSPPLLLQLLGIEHSTRLSRTLDLLIVSIAMGPGLALCVCVCVCPSDCPASGCSQANLRKKKKTTMLLLMMMTAAIAALVLPSSSFFDHVSAMSSSRTHFFFLCSAIYTRTHTHRETVTHT